VPISKNSPPPCNGAKQAGRPWQAKTTLLALAASAAAGLAAFGGILWWSVVAFHAFARHPVHRPAGLILAAAGFLAFAVLVIVYVKARKRQPSVKWVALDIATALLFCPLFAMAFSRIFNWLSMLI
jgi:apolipoprotein N-acyltransferase